MTARPWRLGPPVLAAAALQLASVAGVEAAELKPVVPMSGRAALNGYWEIDDSSRRTSARVELTPAGQAIAKGNAEVQAARLARGQIVGINTYICGVNGVPNIYTTSEPWALVVTDDEVVQVAERPSLSPRHFYMDGRGWPDVSKLPPSSSGYSIGHWDGDVLVVETRGMPAGNGPAGGLKGPGTTLTERFEVTDGGKRLRLSFTLEDPALIAKPVTLSYMYDRNPPGTYAYGDFCDPNENNSRTVEAAAD